MRKCVIGLCLTTVLCIVSVHAAPAKVETSPLIIGQTLQFSSDTLQQPVRLKVYLPASYHSTKKRYPVLYLLDGNHWFLQGASLSKLLGRFAYTPEFIVVGVPTSTLNRFSFFKNAKRATTFLEQDVFNTIDNTFRSSKERLLFGWQYAGAYAVELLIRQPDLVDGYFVASPFPLDDERLALFDVDTEQANLINKTLFMASSWNEGRVTDGLKQLTKKLREHPKSVIRWKHHVLEYETLSSAGHRSTPLGTLYQGLRFHYSDYPALEFESLAAYHQAGGYTYVLDYYQHRAKKYGVRDNIPKEGMSALVRMAMKEDHYPTFHQLLTRFIPQGFLSQVRMSWALRYADFYLRYSKVHSAQKIYFRLTQLFPEHASPLKGLGDVALALGDLALAEKYYRQALSKNTQYPDGRRTEYQAALDALIIKPAETK